MAGYCIDEEDISAYVRKGGIIYRQHIMHALADRGYTAEKRFASFSVRFVGASSQTA
jgi:hypothetical protein